tara:strand:- start:60 stop:236 length:177 start_codon:yes stop_codon:yes gene_type:complete
MLKHMKAEVICKSDIESKLDFMLPQSNFMRGSWFRKLDKINNQREDKGGILAAAVVGS